MSEPEVRIGEMRGTARLVIKPAPEPAPVKEEEQEEPRPECREKDNEHGR